MSQNGSTGAGPPKEGAGPPPEEERHEVERPAGGVVYLATAAEAEMYERSRDALIEEYGFHRRNDLVNLGGLLMQEVAMYRAETDLQDETKAPAAQSRLLKAGEELARYEKALGIDKKTRDAGGVHTVDAWLANLKRMGREHGIHIADRQKWLERFVMELSWKVRLLKNGDAEDRAHEGLTEQSVIDWCEQQIEEFHANEKKWAHEVGKVFVGIA